MACCVLTAYFISRLLKACEFLDLGVIDIQYNEFDDGPNSTIQGTTSHNDRLITTKVVLNGMTCAACSASVEKTVSNLDGVKRVAVSLPLSRATVVHNSERVSVKTILSAVEAQGYGANAGQRTLSEDLELLENNIEIQNLKLSFTDAALLSSIISGLETIVWFDPPVNVTRLLRITVAVLAVWVQTFDARVHRNAWRRGLTTSLTMDTLVSLSLAFGAVLSIFNTALYGMQTAKVYWSSISFLTTVIVGGRLLDHILRKQSAKTFARLYQLQEKSIFVKLRHSAGMPVDDMKFVDAATLMPRDEIVIGTGSIIPCDCYVVSGQSLVDQSTMTGESRPVLKTSGDFLMSGTHNLSAEVHAVVSRAQEDSALENLISSISTATENSAADTSSDMVISNFVLVILLLTFFGFAHTFYSWSDHGGLSMTMTINAACERAMAILASACPCALGLATPSAVMAGVDAVWLRGIVVKGGLQTLISISRLTHIVLDKTGTLTTGRLVVDGSEGRFDHLLRILICAAERDEAQTHPVAQSVFQWALISLDESQRRQVNAAEVRRKGSSTSSGISYEIQLGATQRWYCLHAGSERYLVEEGIEVPRSPVILNDDGNQTLVHFAVDMAYAGSLRLRDTVRENAAAVVEHLKDDLQLDVTMLTGDVESEAVRVSKLLGITAVSSHSLPTEKKAFIEQVRSSRNCVAMMGDGLNDAPALSAADVGICISTSSARPRSLISEATNSQVSEVMFTSPDLSRLPELLEVAKRTVRQADWNMKWAICYNVIAVSLAMGFGEPWGLKVDAARAGSMMAFSSISVLAWGLWLRHDLSRVSFRPKVSPKLNG